MRLRNRVGQLLMEKADWDQLRDEEQQLQIRADSEKDRFEGEWKAWVSSLRTNGMRSEDVYSLVQALTNDLASVRVEATKVLRQIGLEEALNASLTDEARLSLRNAGKLAVP